MAINAPFSPMGNLITITAAAAPGPAPVQLVNTTLAPNNIEIINPSTTDAFLVYAETAAEAVALATAGIPAPVTRGSKGMIAIPAGSDKVYSLSPKAFYTAITATGSASLWLLAGDGS